MAKISEALHRAADVHLKPEPDSPSTHKRPRAKYSCDAVMFSADSPAQMDAIMTGLHQMGLDPYVFNAFKDVKDPQGARYMWLKFAALMAEEQGV